MKLPKEPDVNGLSDDEAAEAFARYFLRLDEAYSQGTKGPETQRLRRAFAEALPENDPMRPPPAIRLVK